MIAIINGDMLDSLPEPGEYVDWSEPDTFTEAEFTGLVDMDVETYAARNPHMIIWEVTP